MNKPDTISLRAWSSLPEMEDIRRLLAEADRQRGRLIEQPCTIPGHTEPFTLTVKHELGSEVPIWTLYQGAGTDSRVVWNCADMDVYLVYDVVSMLLTPASVSQSSAATPQVTGEASVSYFDTITPVDFELLKKQPNILLGHLLVEAGFLPAPMLDEALKLQEMVRTESLTPRQAIDALRRTYARAFGQTSPSQESTPQAEPPNNNDILMAVDLLKQAGFVSEDDIKVASKVQRKHGGELDKILIAARKIDEATLLAALTCWPLIRDSLMKPEQAIIALHYCNRTRVGLQEALSELGFES